MISKDFKFSKQEKGTFIIKNIECLRKSLENIEEIRKLRKKWQNNGNDGNNKRRNKLPMLMIL